MIEMVLSPFSSNQQRLAKLLLEKSCSAEQLQKATNLPLSTVSSELKELLRLEVLEKHDGFPVEYSLKPAIVEELKRRKELREKDPNPLRLRVTIEGQGVEPEILKKQMATILNKLQEDKSLVLYSATQASTLKNGETYSTYLDVTLSVKGFRTLVELMYVYGPTTVEVVSPSKLELTADDLQDGLNDWSGWIHRYAEALTKLMNRSELENFNRKLLKKI